MPFAGGPANGYVLHALATLVEDTGVSNRLLEETAQGFWQPEQAEPGFVPKEPVKSWRANHIHEST